MRGFGEEVWDRLNVTLGERRRKRDGKECFRCFGGQELTGGDATVFAFWWAGGGRKTLMMGVACSSPESKKFVMGLDAVMDDANGIQ